MIFMHFIRQVYKFATICVLLYLTLIAPCMAQRVDDSWDVVRQQFALDHQINHPQVKKQLRWLVSHPHYLNQLKSAEPYIYHIITEIQKKHLPGELALIPMIESSYNPFAYSSAGASGLWQLMPATSSDYGIKKDWWMDGRRNIHSSTNAALNYFKNLERYFNGDWLLAIAAYDCGEGTIRRQLKNTPPTLHSFWYLSLPEETQNYVPRLLALAEIIAHPNRYRVKLPYFPHQPYFAEVHIKKQIDLNHAAKLAGMNFKDFMRLNPGFKHWSTSPNQLTKLLIPTRQLSQFHQNLNKFPQLESSIYHYKVQHGDSLSSIAQKYHTNIYFLAHINHLNNHYLKPGQQLDIPMLQQQQQLYAHHSNHPIAQPLSPKFYKVIHIVQENESIEHLVNKYRISSYQISAWNQLTNNQIIPGQMLVIWKQTNQSPTYEIKPGDTLNQIAKLHGMNVSDIIHLNPMISNRPLKIGEKINVV
ncbi:MAG: LysM peptidoglycan-binding domain-containing protein [Gammaproteobacteria bacterium]|nr:LysM peptidoglycan-binding domain-containing protein [Gammaproteobacteria bacterium]